MGSYQRYWSGLLIKYKIEKSIGNFQFFVYIYEYYQQKGFTCIALRYLFSLLRFAFVVFFSTFLFQCIDYDVLFYNRNTTLDGAPLPPKRGIQVLNLF